MASPDTVVVRATGLMDWGLAADPVEAAHFSHGPYVIDGTGLATWGFIWGSHNIWYPQYGTPSTAWSAQYSTPSTTWTPQYSTPTTVWVAQNTNCNCD